MNLNVYRMHAVVEVPRFATPGSACFDIQFNSGGKHEYSGYNEQNGTFKRPMHDGRIFFAPGDRIMVPTGLIFDIPEGYSVRLHARSGLSLKKGLTLVNAEGVIDSDYKEEIYALMVNTSSNGYFIENKDRICQGELIKNVEYQIMEISNQPERDSIRMGGMGSTGVNIINANQNTEISDVSNITAESIPQAKRGRGRPRKVAN